MAVGGSCYTFIGVNSNGYNKFIWRLSQGQLAYSHLAAPLKALMPSFWSRSNCIERDLCIMSEFRKCGGPAAELKQGVMALVLHKLHVSNSLVQLLEPG